MSGAIPAGTTHYIQNHLGVVFVSDVIDNPGELVKFKMWCKVRTRWVDKGKLYCPKCRIIPIRQLLIDLSETK